MAAMAPAVTDATMIVEVRKHVLIAASRSPGNGPDRRHGSSLTDPRFRRGDPIDGIESPQTVAHTSHPRGVRSHECRVVLGINASQDGTHFANVSEGVNAS